MVAVKTAKELLPLRNARLLQRVARRAGTWAPADVVAFELAVEGGAADAEHSTGKRFVAFYLFEDTLDGGAFDVFEIGCGERNRRHDLIGT